MGTQSTVHISPLPSPFLSVSERRRRPKNIPRLLSGLYTLLKEPFHGIRLGLQRVKITDHCYGVQVRQSP
uniref:Uncharacterized protein n=1 Tax=Oryza punctata TaxID=4537 RepID=A0A0E0LIL9_ORYPU